MGNILYSFRLWKSRLSSGVLKLAAVYGALIFAQSIFGGAAVVYRASLKGVNPLTFLFFRQVFSGPLMVAFAYCMERQWPKFSMQLGSFALAGFAGIFLGQLMYILGVFFSGAIIASVCQLIQAPLVATLAIVFKMEKFSWLKLAGLVISIAGAIVLIAGNGFNIGFSAEGTKSLGVFILVAQNIFTSFMIILQKQLTADNGPLTTAAFITMFSVPWTALTSFATLRGEAWNVSTTAAVGIVYAIFAVGLVGGNLYGWAVKHTDSSIVGASVTLNPLVASIFAAIFLSETVGWKEALGGALILMGFAVTSYTKYQETKTEELEQKKRDPERAELIEEREDDGSAADSVELSSMTSTDTAIADDEDEELS